MSIIDRLPTDAPAADITVIGSGPAGLAVALACADAGRSVLVLESGQRGDDRGVAALSDAEIVDPDRHMLMALAVRRGLGGTSSWWGGRAVPLDEVDFSPRFTAQGASWPIAYGDMVLEHAAAAEFFGLGSAQFEAPSGDFVLPDGVRTTDLEAWCPEINVARLHKRRLEAVGGPCILVGATVVGLEFSDTGCVVGLEIATPDGRRKLATKAVVIACGGLETTRLLLVAQRAHPHLFGGPNGPLGRYYMGHISGKIASLALTRSSDAEYFDFSREPGRAFVRRRVTFEKQTLIDHGIQNVSFWFDNPPFYDATHRSGILSLVYLALLFPPVGRRILSEAVRISHTGPPPRRYLAHAWNIFGAPLETASTALRILHERYSPQSRKPGFIIRNSAARYALHYHGEQRPNAESRVTLANSVDALGMPRLKIDLRYAKEDVASIIAAHDHLANALAESGKGRLDFWDAPGDRARRVEDQARDGFHQIGTTRMSAKPEEGVTDGDCRVHGLDNLYVASSSVFPTSGQANPTFATVALALRLAQHLCR